jgi:hypothetical protein
MLDACNVESLEDYNEHAAAALPHNMDASNAAHEAPGLESAAINGADALEASLASESTGVLTISLGVLHSHRYSEARTRAHRKQVGRLHFILQTPRQWLWHRALLSTIDSSLAQFIRKALRQGIARSACLPIMGSMCRWMPNAPLLDSSLVHIGRESCVVT